MRRVVRKIIIDFDYTLLPEYDKVYPLNDDEALVVENLIKSNLVEHKMEISDEEQKLISVSHPIIIELITSLLAQLL